jgi:UDP-N-acetylmuramate dehydrogenase
MKILKDNSLANYTTMRLGGYARHIIELNTEADIIEAIEFAEQKKIPFLCIGDGSNIIFTDRGFDGVVFINKIFGYKINALSGLVQINSGENWNEMVHKTVRDNLCGIESLALIPGTTGAAPVNNIGAYGQEIKDTLVSLRAYDINKNKFVELSNKECDFAYRNSRFKSKDYGRYIISSITLQLNNIADKKYNTPIYESLNKQLIKNNITNPSPKQIMETVIEIRKSKLPDPKYTANTGSFFKNPVMPIAKVNNLLKQFADLPNYSYNLENKKISAAWLIESVGLKDFRQDGMWVYSKQPLVLVNESTTKYKDLAKMKDYIINKVKAKFGITLEPEPEIIE